MELTIFIILLLTVFVVFMNYRAPHLLPSIWEDCQMVVNRRTRRLLVEQRQDLHYKRSAIWSFWFVVIAFPIPALQLQHAGFFLTGLFCALMAFIVNGVREAYYYHAGGEDSLGFKNIPFDWRDVRFGTYGGWHGGMAAFAICSLILLVIKSLT